MASLTKKKKRKKPIKNIFSFFWKSKVSDRHPDEDDSETAVDQEEQDHLQQILAVDQAMDSSSQFGGRLSLHSATRREAIKAAQTQERAIRERLRKEGTPFPPYKFLELIGKGTYGRVYKCTDLNNKQLVALKVLDADTADYKADVRGKDESIDSTLHEIKVLQQLSGGKTKNINRILDAFCLHSQIWIVNEYCPGGSIHTLLRAANENRLKEKHIVAIARELAEGLKSIHDAGIIHRDIKAANVMINEEGSLQIIDFGVAGMLQTKVDKRSTMIGTLHWMAPELLIRTPGLKYGTEVDVWAYGCTLIECATGNPPNPRQRHPDGIELMKNPPRLEGDKYSKELRDFVAFILQAKPADRPTMAGICNHPFIFKTEKKYATKSLSELVDRFKQWEAAGGHRVSLFNPGGAAAVQTAGVAYDEDGEWNFSTALGDEDDIVRGLNPLALAETPVELTTPTNRLLSSPPNRNRAFSARLQNMDQLTLKSTSSTSPNEDLESSFLESSPQNPQISLTPALDSDLSLSPPQHDADDIHPDESFSPVGSNLYEINASTSLNNSTNGPSDMTFKEEQSVLRGERSLKAIFMPPTSDLPLRSGESTSTHSQELHYDAVVGPAQTALPTVDLSNIAHAKANAQSKRKTMEWTFPSKVDAATDAPIIPARPELKHAVTAPVGFHEATGTLNLDDMWGEDLESATAPHAYTFGAMPSATTSAGNEQRFSATLDLDALMRGEHEDGATAVDKETEVPLNGVTQRSEIPASPVLRTAAVEDEVGFTLRPSTSGPRPPRALASFRRGEVLPPMPAFPIHAMGGGASQADMTGSLQDMLAGLCDTLGALSAEFEEPFEDEVEEE